MAFYGERIWDSSGKDRAKAQERMMDTDRRYGTGRHDQASAEHQQPHKDTDVIPFLSYDLISNQPVLRKRTGREAGTGWRASLDRTESHSNTSATSSLVVGERKSKISIDPSHMTFHVSFHFVVHPGDREGGQMT